MIFALLSPALFGHFDTFPGGWVGGWVVKIKNKDHLSPAEAVIGAELGKKTECKLTQTRCLLGAWGVLEKISSN